MTIEQRLSNLEKLVNALSKKMDDNKFYQQADIDGTRQNISEITPYTETKIGYIGDTEIVFSHVPSGTWFVSFSNDVWATKITRDNGTLIVEFLPLEEVTEVTLTVR